jgi:autotransporter-associated beta strand protein
MKFTAANHKVHIMETGSYAFLFACAATTFAAHAVTNIVNSTPANNQAALSSQAGQTFTTPVLGSDNRLSSITLRGPSSGSNATVYTMKVWVDTDGNFATWNPGTLVATSTNSLTITNGGNSVFTFSEELLSSGTVYAFSLSTGGSDHVAFRPGLTNAAGVALTNGAVFSAGAQPFSGAFDASFIVTTSQAGNQIIWNADVNTTWDVGTTANWEFPSTSPTTFTNGNEVTFNNTDPVGTVVLSGTIEPAITTFNASTTAYTLSGNPIAGTGSVMVSQGSVTLLNDNTYSNTTTITSGSLTLGNGGASGSLGSGSVSNNAQLIVNRSGTPAINNLISGAGSLLVNGPGSLTLSGNSTFTGATTITDGAVILGHASGIGRSGTFGGSVTVRDGTFDTNGFTNYVNAGQPGGPATWLTTATVTLGGQAAGTPVIADTSITPKGIAFANTTAIVYDSANDPGTATVAARWNQVGTFGTGTRSVQVGNSVATAVELDFTGGLGDIAAIDGHSITIRKTGAGTMRVSSGNTFPRLRVSEGTLLANDSNALGASRTATGGLTHQVTVDDTGILDLNGFSPSIGALADSGVNTGKITNNAAATTSTLSVGSAGTSTAYKGIIEDGTGIVALNIIGGSLTLGETKTYTGDTTVTGGTLRLNTTALASQVIVPAGGNLASGTDAAAGTGVLDSLSMNGGIASLRVSDLGSDKIVVTTSNGFSVDTPSTINVIDIDPDGLTLPFTTNIIEYSGTVQGAAGSSGLAVPQHGPSTITDTGSAIQLTLTGNPADTLIWVGNVDGNWTVNGASNWKLLSDSSSVPIYELDKVLFNDSATGPTTITLGAAVTPGSLEFNNSTLPYTLQGAPVTGTTGIVKNGSATATILADSTYTGGTTVLGGTLAFGNGGTEGEIGRGAVIVDTGATLELNTSDFLNYKTTPKMRNVSGGGDIVLTGGGTLWNYPGTGVGFADANSWNNFTGNLIIKGGSEFQTIRNGSTAMGTGDVILGDATTSGKLSQIEGNWTWTSDIILTGADNRIINRSVGAPRSMKIQGVISGSGGLTFDDATATLTNNQTGFILTGENTMSGTLTIPGGVPVRIGGVPGNSDILQSGPDAFGSLGSASVANEGILTFSRTDSHTVGNTISGTGQAFIGLATGTATQVVTYTGTKSYTGPTTIRSGTLLLDTTLPDSPVVVEAAGTLGGTGTLGIASSVSGTIAPGTGVGTLTSTADIALENGSKIAWQVGDWNGSAGTGYDTLSAASLTIGAIAATPVVIVITGESLVNFSETAKTFTLATTSTGISGLDAGEIIIDDTNAPGSGTWSVQVTGNNLELVYSIGNAYDAFESANGISGAGADTDSDGDGIPNGIEFVIGGDPSGPDSDSNAPLPTATVDATNLSFVFRRTDASAGFDPIVEYSSTLAGWTTAQDGVGGVVITEDNNFYGPSTDRVTVTLPRTLSTGSELFARLRIDIP